jgi:hypothetical protein
LLEDKITYKDLSSLHIALIRNCPEFRVIRDVGDASKHGELRPQKKIPRILSSSEQIMRHPSLWEFPLGLGVFNEAAIVMVRLDDGTSKPLEEAVRSVFSMWETML